MKFWKWLTYDREAAERRINLLKEENEKLKDEIKELEHDKYFNLGRDSAMREASEIEEIDLSDIIDDNVVDEKKSKATKKTTEKKKAKK